MNINPAERKGGEKKIKAERGVIKIQYIQLTSWFTVGNYHSSRMAGPLLWESRAGEQCLSQILPPENCHHLKTPHTPEQRGIVRTRQKDRWERYVEVSVQRQLEKLGWPTLEIFLIHFCLYCAMAMVLSCNWGGKKKKKAVKLKAIK